MLWDGENSDGVSCNAFTGNMRRTFSSEEKLQLPDYLREITAKGDIIERESQGNKTVRA